MNKFELIDAVARQNDLPKVKAEQVVNSVFDIISAELENDGRVQIVGFGTFEVRKRIARDGKDPRTGAEIKIPATKTPAFRAGKPLKSRIKKKKIL